MKDLLYVIGQGSTNNNMELRYSLRSIEKYCTNYDRVFIVGYKPDFINENIIFIPCEDICVGYKHHNILWCIQNTAFTTDISDDFVLQSDDHFYCSNYDFDTIPVYMKEMLQDSIPEEHKYNMYMHSLVNTRKLLEKYDYPYYNCSQHCGTLLNKQIIKKLNNTIIQDAHFDYECAEPTCIISNPMIKEHNLTPVHRDDIKIEEPLTKEAFYDRIKDNFCFSLNDDAIDDTMREILSELYPNKSIYEK